MSKWYVLGGVGVLLLLIGYVFYQGQGANNEVSESNTQVAEQMNGQLQAGEYSEQTDDTGPVSVTVKPLSLSDSGDWTFELTLQTHSVDLTMDIVESVVLIAGDGSEIKPTSWDGDPPEGHHRTGIVSFSAPDSDSQSITIEVRNVAGVPAREFSWQF
tara:strand:+ start:854 stop:1327 length:474 start_codon:yes stop_codon:yes gene_type:complete